MIYEYHDRNKATKEELIEDIVSIETDNFIFESGGKVHFVTGAINLPFKNGMKLLCKI